MSSTGYAELITHSCTHSARSAHSDSSQGTELASETWDGGIASRASRRSVSDVLVTLVIHKLVVEPVSSLAASHGHGPRHGLFLLGIAC
eukprot:7386495-Prymnesium_polylepis.1